MFEPREKFRGLQISLGKWNFLVPVKRHYQKERKIIISLVFAYGLQDKLQHSPNENFPPVQL
jgi:hypothetical protein